MIGIVPTVLYGAIRRLWWTFDDAFLLHYAIRYHPWQYLFSPQIWNEIPQRLFTPILPLAYDTDIVLFGVDSRGYYFHHLLELVVLAVLLYTVLRLWYGAFGSAAGAILALLGAPMCAWASQLMLRHYVESTIAALAATVFWVVGLRRRSFWLACLSGCAYFVAICAKEIAVPLPLFLFLIPEQPIRVRARTLLPHGVALTIYAVWRIFMLGTAFGGYGWAVTSREVPGLIASLPAKIVASWVGASPPVIGGLLLAAIILVAALQVRSWRHAGMIAAGLALTVLPIAPASKEMQLRFAMPSWFVVAIAAAAGLDLIRKKEATRRAAAVALIVVLAAGVALNRWQWQRTFADASRMSMEGRAFVNLQKGDILRNPMVPPAAMGELAWLKTEILHGPPGAAWTYDDIYFCGATMRGRVVEFERGAIKDVTPLIAAYGSQYCRAERIDEPLEVTFTHRGESLFWELGPYVRGRYRFVLADGLQAFDVPRVEGFQLPGVHSIALRVRYVAPQGWVTYSPVLTLEFAKTTIFHWSRPNDRRRIGAARASSSG